MLSNWLRLNNKPVAVLIGPVLFVIIYLIPMEGITAQGRSVLAVTAWVAFWWITEAIPIAATSLVPIVLFPLTGGLSLAQTTASYGHKMIFLYLGGFIIALAIEKWNLHKRIALQTIRIIGRNADLIILGFMLATFFLSMWISNTATTMMMLPIAVAVANKLDPLNSNGNNGNRSKSGFGLSLMLAIAYSASIGGLSTLIGTPTNAMFAAVVKEIYNVDIDFATWISFALPISSILLFISWVYLVKFVYPVKIRNEQLASSEIETELKALGKVTREEKRVTVVFAITALAWILRSLVLKRFIPNIDDTIIAIVGALVLFLIPSTKKGKMLMDWSTATKLPWGILILFGGGLSIAAGFQSSGLAFWIGNSLEGLQSLQIVVVLFIVALLVNGLTELTSNVATASILLPILASLAGVIHIHPFMLMVVATLNASCAFMLPVATPPNAVVFSSGYIRIRDMARTGVGMNLISIVIVVLIVWFLMPVIWGIDPYGTL